MKELIDWIENKIERCDDHGEAMSREKWAFQQCLKKARESITIDDVFQEEEKCGKSNCNRPKLDGNVYCQYHYDINFG